MSDGDSNRDRAERAFKQAEKGKTAMAERQAERQALREKTARLRAQRLAKEAEERRSPTAQSEAQTGQRQPPRNQHIRRAAD
jgi:hypothetical protein